MSKERAALSAADAVRDGSASGAVDAHITFLSRLKDQCVEDGHDLPFLVALDAAIAALRQPVTLREVAEADAYTLTGAFSNVAFVPMDRVLKALRQILPHGIPVNGSEGERG